MDSPSIDKESVWRETWILAPEGPGTFYEQLEIRWTSARALNQGGSLISISKNSVSQSYANPGNRTRTTVDNERIILEAIKLYEKIQSDLGVSRDADGEQQIYEEGIIRLRVPATEYSTDVSTMRCFA